MDDTNFSLKIEKKEKNKHYSPAIFRNTDEFSKYNLSKKLVDFSLFVYLIKIKVFNFLTVLLKFEYPILCLSLKVSNLTFLVIKFVTKKKVRKGPLLK